MLDFVSAALSLVFGGVFLLGLGRLIPPFKEPPRSVEVSPAKKGETAVRRHAKFADKLLETPAEGAETLFGVLEVGSHRHELLTILIRSIHSTTDQR